MPNVTRVIATTHEVSLKGGNRRWFERRLTANTNRALAGLPVASLTRPAWRLLVTFSHPVPFTEVARRLSTVFGLSSILPVHHAGYEIGDVIAALTQRVTLFSPRSFAVRCTRSDKSFSMTSVEIERAVGGAVQDLTGWPVDLSGPDLTIHLLLDRNGFWIWMVRVPGPGGLPVGTGGRGLCMLSGGIDSPVAAYLMMKRGMRLDFVHFHSVPTTDPASLEKVRELVRILNRYQNSARLVMVPLLPVQKEIVQSCPSSLRILLYRRFMMRIGESFAQRFRTLALITGESLGQVASQTVENLTAVQSVTSLPVLRPLIGFDKQEIITLARRAGTYDVSIQPHIDCCTYFVPDHPETGASAGELSTAENVLDVGKLTESAVKDATIERIAEAAAWERIPVPPEAMSERI
ncbi:MAG: tRNA 4-thiouridine(8) synthase ThiI [Acidobacteria bacterium]|nr:tRNA 4-thiouridine(8) synthase ThiI [Acidobacteriota bacterium]